MIRKILLELESRRPDMNKAEIVGYYWLHQKENILAPKFRTNPESILRAYRDLTAKRKKDKI